MQTPFDQCSYTASSYTEQSDISRLATLHNPTDSGSRLATLHNHTYSGSRLATLHNYTDSRLVVVDQRSCTTTVSYKSLRHFSKPALCHIVYIHSALDGNGAFLQH